MAHFSNKDIHILIFASCECYLTGPQTGLCRSGLSAQALNVVPSILTRGVTHRRDGSGTRATGTDAAPSPAVSAATRLGETRKDEVLLEDSRGSAAQLTP